MQSKYLIRLDDACPTMDAVKWQRMEEILDKYQIKPMVGIIPHNEDPKQIIDAEDEIFWDKALNWQNKGWAIALHGYNHCYISNEAGINPMWNRSEFAGVSLDVQRQKIRDGVKILRDKGLNPKYFFAPSHTFDNNTLRALKEESDIRVVSDTITLNPYTKDGFLFIPQIIGHCVKMPIGGTYTFCFHPTLMNDVSFDALESFLSKFYSSFVTFDLILTTKYSGKSMIDRFVSWVFFTQRKLRGLK